MTRADTNDIYWNIHQMGWYTHIFAANTYQVYVDPTDSAAVALEAQIQQKMNGLNSEISYVCTQIAETIDALWQVQHRLVNYENTDDSYASKASSLYRSKIGWSDWLFETLMYWGTSFFSGLFDGIGNLLSGVGGLLMYAGSEIGCLICSLFGGAPDFLVNYRDSYRQGFATFLKDPGAAVATMFQDFTDEVDSDPLYAFGSLVPDIAMMVFGTKGIEKLAKGVEATRSLEAVDELGAGGKVAKGVEGAEGVGSAGGKIITKSLDDLPPNVQNAYKGYEGNGWTGNYKGQAPGTKAGKQFFNSENLLPKTDVDGYPLSYKVFDINSPTIESGRDAERFVVAFDNDSVYSVYYTDSHYGETFSLNGLPSFIRIE